MVFTVKDDLALLRDLKLTAKQLVFIKMLVRDPSMEEGTWRRQSYAMALEYQKLCPMSADELADLVAREIVIDYNSCDGPIYYDCYEINSKYQRRFALAVSGMATDLADFYPNEISNKNFTFLSKDCGAEEIAPKYLKAINKDEKEHERVMDDLKWAKEHNVLQTGLKKFVETKFWLHIRELRKRVTPKPVSNARIG